MSQYNIIKVRSLALILTTGILEGVTLSLVSQKFRDLTSYYSGTVIHVYHM